MHEVGEEGKGFLQEGCVLLEGMAAPVLLAAATTPEEDAATVAAACGGFLSLGCVISSSLTRCWKGCSSQSGEERTVVHGGIKRVVALLRPPRWAPFSCLVPDPDRSRWVIAAALVVTTGERQGSGYTLQEDGVLNGTDVAGGERLSLLW